MSEQTGIRRDINGTLLTSSFESLDVRRAWVEGFWGAGRFATHVPTPNAWAQRKPQEIGVIIGGILAGGEAGIMLHSVNKPDIPRQLAAHAFPTGKQFAKPVREGGPILAAEVTSGKSVGVGLGRMLPVLQLMEFGNPPVEQEFIVAVSDIAKRVQSGTVEITVT